jgi:hypothetical protein
MNPGSSQNHFMLGHAEEWFYRGLAGIDFDLSRRNADRIRLRPALESGASDASATLNTVLGQVSSSWSRSGKEWSAKFVIPAGCQATLILPVGAIPREVQIHGATVNSNESSAATGRQETRILGSGSYTFTGSL